MFCILLYSSDIVHACLAQALCCAMQLFNSWQLWSASLALGKGS
jgi:hypothetical protein